MSPTVVWHLHSWVKRPPGFARWAGPLRDAWLTAFVQKPSLKWRFGRAKWKKTHTFPLKRLIHVHKVIFWIGSCMCLMKKIYIYTSCLFTVYLSNSIIRQQVQTVPLWIKESQLSSKWLITHMFIKINAVRSIIMPTWCKISTVYPDVPGFPATCHSQGQHLEAVKRRAYSFVVAPQSYDGGCIGTSPKHPKICFGNGNPLVFWQLWSVMLMA